LNTNRTNIKQLFGPKKVWGLSETVPEYQASALKKTLFSLNGLFSLYLSTKCISPAAQWKDWRRFCAFDTSLPNKVFVKWVKDPTQAKRKKNCIYRLLR